MRLARRYREGDEHDPHLGSRRKRPALRPPDSRVRRRDAVRVRLHRRWDVRRDQRARGDRRRSYRLELHARRWIPDNQRLGSRLPQRSGLERDLQESALRLRHELRRRNDLQLHDLWRRSIELLEPIAATTTFGELSIRDADQSKDGRYLYAIDITAHGARVGDREGRILDVDRGVPGSSRDRRRARGAVAARVRFGPAGLTFKTGRRHSAVRGGTFRA